MILTDFFDKYWVTGDAVDDIPDGQVEDKTSNSISSTSILKEKIHDISVEEEAEIQKKLSQAKAEIQNLILEGQRLKQANQQLQHDIDSHSTKRWGKEIYLSSTF